VTWGIFEDWFEV